MSATDELYMQRALDLALLGEGRTRPNPMVGCVIVYRGRVIGEGWHRQYGGPHAEVEAVRAVQHPELLPESTVYVTLEPCSHFGKTPPCADLLIEKGVREVVVCNQDPNPLVAGKGLQKLRQAGISVRTGVLEAQGRQLNRRFFTIMERQRPYVLLKWAQTADGFLARPDFSSKWISGDFARLLVHKWRTEEAAIMVGTNTALHDNPRLNARDWTGPQPTRVVLDCRLRLPQNLNLFDRSQPTLVYNRERAAEAENLQHVLLPDGPVLEPLLHELHQRQLQSLLVEGGAQLLQGFLDHNFWDEARIFVSRNTFTHGIAAPKMGLAGLTEEMEAGEDRLFVYRNPSPS